MQEDDPLSRIQREIKEVTEREREFKEGHFRSSNGNDAKEIPQTVPTPLASSTPNGNTYYRRLRTGTKGIMQRFIANKGKLPVYPPYPAIRLSTTSPIITRDIIIDNSTSLPPVVARTGQPLRKGFVPVQEKIKQEMREMRDREYELKRMRKEQRSYDNDIDTSSESEDEDVSPPGTLKPAKSLGELYESLSDEMRTSSRLAPDDDSLNGSLGSLKPAKSLAELCEMPPDLAPRSTLLIAQWESLIQKKSETV